MTTTYSMTSRAVPSYSAPFLSLDAAAGGPPTLQRVCVFSNENIQDLTGFYRYGVATIALPSDEFDILCGHAGEALDVAVTVGSGGVEDFDYCAHV